MKKYGFIPSKSHLISSSSDSDSSSDEDEQISELDWFLLFFSSLSLWRRCLPRQWTSVYLSICLFQQLVLDDLLERILLVGWFSRSRHEYAVASLHDRLRFANTHGNWVSPSLRCFSFQSIRLSLETKYKGFVPDIRTVSVALRVVKSTRESFLATATKSGTHWSDVSLDTKWGCIVRTSVADRNRSASGRACQAHRCGTQTTWTFLQTKFVPLPHPFWTILPLLPASPNHMPFVRSYDENNGRVVFNYSPETCGYVSHRGVRSIRIQDLSPFSSFDRASVAIVKVVDKHPSLCEVQTIPLYFSSLVLRVAIWWKRFKCKRNTILLWSMPDDWSENWRL